MDDLDRFVIERCERDPEFKRLYEESQSEYDAEMVRIRREIAAKRIIGAFSFPEGASPNDSLAKEREV